MILTEEKYPLLYKDRHLCALIRGLKEVLLSCDKNVRLDMAKTLLGMEKDTYIDKIRRATKISRIVNSNKSFADDFGIDIDKLDKSLSANIKYFNAEMKKKRANPNYIIFGYHEFIFCNLQRYGYGQTKQVNFMYDLYMECDFQGCKSRLTSVLYKSMRDKLRKALKDRIRKSQEKFMKQIGPWDYGIE